MPDDPTSGPAGPSLADVASAGLDKARAFLAARNADAAIREAERVLELDPDGHWGYLALDVIGDARCEKKDYAAVIKIGRELLATNPERLEGYIQLANGALEQDDMATCLHAIEHGLERYPNSVSLITLNSHRLRRCQDSAGAIEWGRKAAALAPRNLWALETLALAFIHAERFEDARRVIADARAIDPMSSSGFSIAAVEAYDTYRFAEAEALALQALALDPQDDVAAHIAHRASWFKSRLMRPFWVQQRLPMTQRIVLAIVLIPLVGLIFVYLAICRLTIRLVQAVDNPKRPKKQLSLKDY